MPAAPWLVPALTRSAEVEHWVSPAVGAEVVGVAAGAEVLADGLGVAVAVTLGDAAAVEDVEEEEQAAASTAAEPRSDAARARRATDTDEPS